MTRKTAEVPTGTPPLRSGFRYTPGDGRVYEWSAGERGITVSDIVSSDPWVIRLVDVIPFPPTLATATALMDAVDSWILAGL